MFNNDLLNTTLEFIGANTICILTLCSLIRWSNKKTKKAKRRVKVKTKKQYFYDIEKVA